MRVVLTDSAKRDLFKIGEDIRREAPTRAEPFVQALVSHCDQLAEMPRRYPLVPRYEDRGIRRCVHGSYLNLLPRARGVGGSRPHPAWRQGLRIAVVS